MLRGLQSERLGRSYTLDLKHVVHRNIKPKHHGRLSYASRWKTTSLSTQGHFEVSATRFTTRRTIFSIRNQKCVCWLSVRTTESVPHLCLRSMQKAENLSFEGNVLRWTIPEHRSSRSYFARNGSIMAQRWRGLALVVHCMSSAARGIGPKNIKSHCFSVSWLVYVLFYCYWSTRVYKKTFSYILKCQYIISIIWIIHSVEYTYNEVLQVRYRIGLMDNVESRFARTRY